MGARRGRRPGAAVAARRDGAVAAADPGRFGLFAVGLVVFRLAESVGRQCVGLALVQRFALTARHVAAGFCLALAGGAALAAAMWASAPMLARWLAMPELAAILETLAPVCMVTGVGIVSEYLLHRTFASGA